MIHLSKISRIQQPWRSGGSMPLRSAQFMNHNSLPLPCPSSFAFSAVLQGWVIWLIYDHGDPLGTALHQPRLLFFLVSIRTRAHLCCCVATLSLPMHTFLIYPTSSIQIIHVILPGRSLTFNWSPLMKYYFWGVRDPELPLWLLETRCRIQLPPE